MSDHHSDSASGNNDNPSIKLAIMVVVAALALILGIVMLSQFAVGTHNLGATVDTANTAEAVAKRIAPLTSLVTEASAATAPTVVGASPTPAAAAPVAAPVIAMAIPAAAPSKAAAPASGESVFKSGCTVCHTAGLAGAPKAGEKAAWAPRIAKGKPLLYEHALKGFNAMPAKGGNAALADADVKAAVDYMVALVK
jgi:cytochrome c5